MLVQSITAHWIPNGLGAVFCFGPNRSGGMPNLRAPQRRTGVSPVFPGAFECTTGILVCRSCQQGAALRARARDRRDACSTLGRADFMLRF